MKRIQLSQGKYALVDDADFEVVSKYRWHAYKHRNTWYAKRNVREHEGINRKTEFMHKLITGYAQTDHENGDGLDNRRANLRDATDQQNRMNMRKSTKPKSSVFKGVHWLRSTGRWHAEIKLNGRKHHLGFFDDEVVAAAAYNQAASELFGEFALLNPVTEGVEVPVSKHLGTTPEKVKAREDWVIALVKERQNVGKPISTAELCRATRMSRPGMNGLLTRLKKAGSVVVNWGKVTVLETDRELVAG